QYPRMRLLPDLQILKCLARHLFSFCLLPSVFCLLSSVFCILPSLFCILPSSPHCTDTSSFKILVPEISLSPTRTLAPGPALTSVKRYRLMVVLLGSRAVTIRSCRDWP